MTIVLSRQLDLPVIPPSGPIYRPKIPAPKADHFKNLIARVQSIGDRNINVIGCSYVLNKKEKSWLPVIITQEKVADKGLYVDFRIFRILGIDDEAFSQIGHASTDLRDSLGPSPRIYIGNIRNHRRDFKYPGYLLIKAIQQTYEKQCEGRVFLHASYAANGFYKKLGFVTVQEPGKLSHMQLMHETSQEWLREINRHPISMPADSCCHIL